MNERDQLEVLELQSFGGQQAIILLLEYILIGLVRGLSARKNPDIVFLSGDSFHSEFVNIVISYLRDNVERRITLTDVCRRFNYSRSFICKIFKEQTGESLIGYFNRLKLERAKQMLCDGGMTVREISEALGFSEPKYFGISFKNCYGKSPKAYRAECRCGNSL
jgi:AraC-like DNA-binding protein